MVVTRQTRRLLELHNVQGEENNNKLESDVGSKVPTVTRQTNSGKTVVKNLSPSVVVHQPNKVMVERDLQRQVSTQDTPLQQPQILSFPSVIQVQPKVMVERATWQGRSTGLSTSLQQPSVVKIGSSREGAHVGNVPVPRLGLDREVEVQALDLQCNLGMDKDEEQTGTEGMDGSVRVDIENEFEVEAVGTGLSSKVDLQVVTEAEGMDESGKKDLQAGTGQNEHKGKHEMPTVPGGTGGSESRDREDHLVNEDSVPFTTGDVGHLKKQDNVKTLQKVLHQNLKLPPGVSITRVLPSDPPKVVINLPNMFVDLTEEKEEEMYNTDESDHILINEDTKEEVKFEESVDKESSTSRIELVGLRGNKGETPGPVDVGRSPAGGRFLFPMRGATKSTGRLMLTPNNTTIRGRGTMMPPWREFGFPRARQVQVQRMGSVPPMSGFVPSMTGQMTPRPRQVSPKMRLVSPKMRLVSPKMRQASPRMCQVSPSTGPAVSMMGLVSPRMRHVSPTMRQVSPKMRLVSPKMRQVSPRMYPVSPRTGPVSMMGLMTPNLELVSTRMELVSPGMSQIILGVRHVSSEESPMHGMLAGVHGTPHNSGPSCKKLKFDIDQNKIG